ncbi:phosphatidylinositol 4-phosphate 3-kinase C2 domain-containing subunit alpha isoform X7 [Plutella xylostella]|uniref:phosphatidylinositol 4-phosphate 3-kinase C2 domain-containing subunit alpha isoform X7 n=1 Tax=Plutella xylostella TaxID=51655 RepID=UPI002032A3B9|nr:phosphatidylinositol 4-phosphate 3-kinase C2 domain-containing subunit alpha isoform X7 [Plutella xylostella]
MSEYELQFQADLEKAQALSLESLALDQFRRQKQLASGAAGVSAERRDSSASREPPPALPPPPRKPPRLHHSTSEGNRSSGTSPVKDVDADLISFSSPTSKAPRDLHANFIEQINKLSLQDDAASSPGDQSPMNNQYFPRGGAPYPPYQYAFPPPYPPAYAASTPYPTPYPMPSPVPYQYYPPPNAMPPDQAGFAASPVYPPPYTLTRLASPAPYQGYPPPAPQYQYNTTNMISRPIRPSLYPQLPQAHTYPVTPGQSLGTPGLSQVSSGPGQLTPGPVQAPPAAPAAINNVAPPVKPEAARDSVESNSSRKSSEVSIASNESADALGSLPILRSHNLIDFGRGGGAGGAGGAGSVRVSVLEAFDPLLTEQDSSATQSIYMAPSECSSVYEEYDPLDFLYGETEIREAPVYAAVGQRETAILRSPPPKTQPRAATNKLYDCIVKVTEKTYDSEHKAFLKMVLDVRKEFPYSDTATNPGYVVAGRSDSRYPANTSIKLQVHPEGTQEPIAFTSDVESTVDHVILTVVCSLDEEVTDMSNFMLRVWGANEYLQPGSSLSEYDYVRECVRLEKDVRLCLHSSIDRELARTERDDAMAQHITLDDLMPNVGTPVLTFDNLSILLETLEGELSRCVGVAGAEGSCPAGAALQAVKAVVALAGAEPLHVTRALQAFAHAAANNGTSLTPEVISERGDYASVRLRSSTAREAVAAAASKLRDAVRGLLALHARSHITDFRLAEPPYYTQLDPANAVPSNTVHESTLVCIEAVHSIPPCLQHEEHLFLAQIFHGTRAISRVASTQPCQLDQGGFYPRIIADTWLNLEDVPISSLPRESRLVLTLIGRSRRDQSGDQSSDQSADQSGEQSAQYEQTELGWAALPMFHHDLMLASGSYLLPLWPRSADKRLGPAPPLYHAPPGPHPLVNIEIPLYAHNGVRWHCPPAPPAPPPPAFDSLDAHTQCQLLHLIEQGPYQKMPTECREIMWEKRQYLLELSGALPLVLLTATAWHGEQRAQLLALLQAWSKPGAAAALHLLLPCFPDADVRALAVSLISDLDDGSFCRCLPQLLAAARSDCAAASPLAALLLRRAFGSVRIAANMFWLLVHGLPSHQGTGQEFLGITLDEGGAAAAGDGAVCSWRRRLLLQALLAGCGQRLAASLQRQRLLVQSLTETAMSVKTGKEGARSRALTSGATQLATLLREQPAALPLSPAAVVHDVNVQQCSYFASNTLPLKINFIGRDNAVIPAMFKIGDDLRQDSLVLQIIRVMDALWLRSGLDLRLVCFQAVPTAARQGMIEIVSEAETLRAIQTEWGLTGSFKDKPIAEWLAKHNPSELEYQRARDNFTASCAGYSVATYLLGICDRHNDNIMLKTSGHLFHIDFGKFLGDAQMFGNFKRDRVPFVLTHDMVYVMNGGDRPTQRFQHFVELCAAAFNVVRAHCAHLLDLLALVRVAPHATPRNTSWSCARPRSTWCARTVRTCSTCWL